MKIINKLYYSAELFAPDATFAIANQSSLYW